MTDIATSDTHSPAADRDDLWWRGAVTYQVYIRSFADGSGDGIGDVAGLRSRLGYLADLGVDAIWINPWYPSPMADGGYDVADYRSVEPLFGTLDDADALVAEAHERGIRIMLDVVPNHTSDQHEWFRAALKAGPGSPERERYIFRPGRGPDGSQPPNNWISLFGGSAWNRVEGEPGEWFLHLFAPEQPDLNWENPEVRKEFESILRFWFDRGVDGFRIDVAHSLFKKAGLPDVDVPDEPDDPNSQPDHPFWDRDEVHDIYRDWRRIADSYDPPRTFVGEAWVPDAERLARYVRADELHTTFNFAFLQSPWLSGALRTAIDSTVATLEAVDAPATWVLSNHDVTRQVSRYARDQRRVTRHDLDAMMDIPADFAVGARRARAAVLLMLALPGGVYLYQGEELGLPEVEDLPEDMLADPTWLRSGGTRRGRDGCRVPIPWSGDAASYGFGPLGADGSWLPQPATWREHSVEALDANPDSILNLYREALRMRRQDKALGDGSMQWRDAPADVLMFRRDPGFICLVNLGQEAASLPSGTEVVLSSDALTDNGDVPTDTAVWLRDTDRA